MAVTSVCGQLNRGQDLSCPNLAKKYFQQAIVINRQDIENYQVQIDSTKNEFYVSFNLKKGKTGYLFRGKEAGSSFFGSADKSTTEQGMIQYLHKTNLILQTADVEGKLSQHELDNGSFLVALQLTNNTVEIYGMEFGMSTADYTLDLQANGGVNTVVLQSFENSQENYLPLIYQSEVEGSENADFDSLFENKGA